MDSQKLMKQLEIYPLHVDADHEPLALLAVQFHLPAAADDLAMVFKATAGFVLASHGQPVFHEFLLINGNENARQGIIPFLVPPDQIMQFRFGKIVEFVEPYAVSQELHGFQVLLVQDLLQKTGCKGFRVCQWVIIVDQNKVWAEAFEAVNLVWVLHEW
jgi:hypothetical protein